MAFYDGPAIGARIAHYRKLNEWTMDELAAQTNEAVGKSVIANLETGRKVDLTVRQLIEISRALGVTPIALFLPVERPFDQEVEQGWNMSVDTLRRVFAGEHPWPRADTSEQTRAGAHVAKLVELSERLSTLAEQVDQDVALLVGRVPESQIRSVVNDPEDVPETDDALLAVELRSLAQRLTTYRLVRELFQHFGGHAHDVDPGEAAVARRLGDG